MAARTFTLAAVLGASLGCSPPPPPTAPAPPVASGTSPEAKKPRAEPDLASPPAPAESTGPKSKAKRLVMNGIHGCAILEDDTLACWGGENRALPRRLAGFDKLTDLALSFGIGAIRADGKVVYTPKESELPRELAELSDVVDIEASWPENFCAIRKDRSVWCYPGAPFLGDTPKENQPVRVGGVADAKALSLGTNMGCAIVGAGALRCWNLEGPPGTAFRAVPVTSIRDAKSLWAGNGSACVRRSDGSLVCFQVRAGSKLHAVGRATVAGVSLYGEDHPFVCAAEGNQIECSRLDKLGAGYGLPALDPGKITASDLGSIVELEVYGNVACARDDRGRIGCWGFNNQGLLGRPARIFVDKPSVVSGIPKAKQIALGDRFSCVVSAAEEVWCWGAMPVKPAELGDPTPKRVVGLSKVKRLSADSAYACAENAKAEMQCFLGVEWPARKRALARVDALDGARAMLLSDLGVLGRVAALNRKGELLVGKTPGFDSLAGLALSAVPGVSGGRRLGGDRYAVVVLDAAGHAYRVGLKDGVVDKPLAPVPALDGATDLAGHHALLASGELVGWSHAEDPSTATSIRKQAPFSELVAGRQACGGTKAGDLVCLEGESETVLLSKMAVLPSSVDEHQCGIDAKGKVWCRGDNRLGQCGVGLGIESSAVPLVVPLP